MLKCFDRVMDSGRKSYELYQDILLKMELITTVQTLRKFEFLIEMKIFTKGGDRARLRQKSWKQNYKKEQREQT